MWRKSEFDTKKQRMSYESFDFHKKKYIFNNQNRIENNRLDGVNSFVKEHTKQRHIMFYRQTTDVFKRYEGVFGNCGKRGKRVIRTF